MKKILHIIDTTGPGGAETVFIDLITGLPAEKYQPIVLIRDKGWVYEELYRRGVRPILMNAKGSFNWRYLKDLASLIRREKVDIIQSHLLGSNVYASIAGLITGKPVVSTFHGAVDIGDKERLKALKFMAINLGSRAIVAVSRDLRDNIINRTSLRSNKTTVIHNGIKTQEFELPHSKRLRKQFGWTEDTLIIGSLGNIRPAKGYDILLHAAGILKERKSNFRFVIAGQGKQGLSDKLISLRKKLGLEETVQFLGFMDNPSEFLSNLDIFLLSSTSEGFSIATIQAMAANLPVLVTKSGGPEEIVTHAQNGWIVEPGSPEAIVDGLMELSNNVEQRKQLAFHGKQHAIKIFDIKQMISSYDAVYRKVS